MADVLRRLDIFLLIDQFRLGDAIDTRERTFEFDALMFFCSPESLASEDCQLELQTALTRGVPIFTVQLQGSVPECLNSRIIWAGPQIESPGFFNDMARLGVAMRERALFFREMRELRSDTPPDETLVIAKQMALEADRTIVAENAPNLAQKYESIVDPSTRHWLALALGKAGTTEAAKLLRSLPQHDHPYALEGVRQALEMVEQN